jgi:hypothetical protein
VEHIDAVSAFTNADMDHEVYVKQLRGMEDWVYRLQKSLYGTKQAGRLWAKLFRGALVKFGFRQSNNDSCLYSLQQADGKTALAAVFVDDEYSVIPDLKLRTELKAYMMAQFEMVDLGVLTKSLGLEVEQHPEDHVTYVSQRYYAEQLLERFGHADCNPVQTPFLAGVRLSKEDCPKTAEERARHSALRARYQAGCGSLMFLATMTRPEIAEPVRALCRFMANPGPPHELAFNQILKYLKGSLGRGITFDGTKPDAMVLSAHSDSDWANDPDTARSVTGLVCRLGETPISWRSRMQPSVALSSAEAEYMALTETFKEVRWLRALLEGIGFPQKPTRVFEDNNAAISMAKRLVSSKRTKHVNVRYHYNREDVELLHVPSADNLADIFTKSTGRLVFIKLRDLLLPAFPRAGAL